MKKHEKYLLGIFGGCAVLSAAFLLYRILVLDKGLGLFDSIDVVLPWFLGFVALFGIIAVMVSWRLRKRAEAGKEPISKLYMWSFILSFVPFAAILIRSVFRGVSETLLEVVVWYAVIIFGLIFPVFPLMIFWQVLYIVKRIQYKEQMKVVSD